MRIKRLELLGFKSSKDKTILEFPDGVTGIVGPNGSGKSNVVDALRWVLGEQSAHRLRGERMEDVIFKGNEVYGPLGMAEVTIVLDNEKGPAPAQAQGRGAADAGLGAPAPEDATDEGEADEGEAGQGEAGDAGEAARDEPSGDEQESEVVRALRRVPELQVTRRLYRSGESEYLINSRPCRLRDITELFLGTGVGTKAYSIVEQGRVNQILHAKPEEIRLFLEEAAGTTLYRSRKLAAERKIERTRDNLLRVSDIVRELERQANSLRRQAKGAVQYQEYRAEESALDQAWTRLRLETVDAGLGEATDAAAEQAGREHALRLEIARAQQERESLRDEARSLDARREEARQAVFAARSAMARTEQERGHLQQRKQELESLLGESGNDLAGLDGQLARLADEAADAERSREELAGQYEAARGACEAVGHAVREADERYFAWSAEAEAMRGRLIEALGATAALRNERASVARQIDAAEAREARLREEENSLLTVRARLQEELRLAEEHLAGLVAALDAAEGSKREAAERLHAAQARRAAAQAEAERTRDECALVRSRIESLEELHRGFSGYNDGVRAFMANGGRERAGAKAVLAEGIEIEAGYERAVAAVLGEALQYIVVPDTASGIEGAKYLRERAAGRASFVPLHAAASGEPAEPIDGALVHHVKVREGFEGLVEPLLARCLVVADLDEAMQRVAAGDAGCTFVTRDGEVVGSRGVVTGGSENPVDEGLLLRNSELRRMRAVLEQALLAASAAQEELRAAVEAASGMDERLVELDRELHELAVQRVHWTGEKRLHEQNSVRTEERGRAVRTELEGVQRERAAAQSRRTELERTLEAREAESARLEQERTALDAEGKSLEAARREVLGRQEQARVAEAEARQRIEAVATRVSAIAVARNEAGGRRDALRARLERSRLEIDSVAAKLTDPLFDVEALRERSVAAERELQARDGEADAFAKALQQVDAGLDGFGQRLDAARAEYGRCELRRKQFELERTSLLEGLAERLGLGAEDVAGAPVPEGRDVASLAAELEVVRGRIRRLGTVNLGAVTELEEIEARLSEMCGQRDDLEKSIHDLGATISKLNRLSKQRFEETFNQVNRIFQEVFPKLFDGGKGYLELTEPDDLLESGVAVFAQPPGTKLSTLTLLSGGQKAMTAIALLFALFLHKPSPFCVLDEVDAPLDFANVGRFMEIVREMAKRSQFLLITHDKTTMEACDILYGVTMPEKGITKMVSVDLSQAA